MPLILNIPFSNTITYETVYLYSSIGVFHSKHEVTIKIL
jgi:hypothetical protein